MAVSTYKHGVTWRDVPTSIRSPITADSGIPVIVGAAPSFQSDDPAPLNVPRLYKSYEEAVAEMGYSEDFASYGICEAMYAFFVLHNTGPIICINVFDGTTGATTVPPADLDIVNKQVVIDEENVLISTVIVKDQADAITYVKDTDYAVAYNNEAKAVISVIPGGAILPAATKLKVGYDTADPSSVDSNEIIGGIDDTTGKGTGLEAVDDVFQVHAIVPGIILCPGFSQDPEVAAVMAAKGENVNGCFRCLAYADVDSATVLKPQDAYAWKNSNNYVSNRLAVFWPRVGISDKQFWLSTQAAALTEWVDHSNGDVPVESPSNKNLKMTKMIAGPVDTPADVFFNKPNADSLNGQGIISAINWIGGWKLWGSNMSIYPSNSDPKDRWLPVRRMMDWLGNTIVLTVYQFVDEPGNRRLIDSIIDSLNIYLNSLVAAGNALGARVEFRHEDNSDVEILAGHYVFHVFTAFPTPAEHIEFLLEFDVSYLSTLFTPVTTQTP